MSNILGNLNVADGTILEVKLVSGRLLIDFVDWQENKWTIIFEGVIAHKDISSINTDISAMLISTDNSFREEVMSLLPEDSDGVNCYQFISSWRDCSVLTILAKSCSAIRLGK